MGGGGSGDGGAADQEAARQTQINAAIDKINQAFDGNAVSYGTGPAVTSYNPGQTYYTADGQAWTAPTVAPPPTVSQASGNGINASLDAAAGRQSADAIAPNYGTSTGINASLDKAANRSSFTAPSASSGPAYDEDAIANAIKNGLYSSETTTPGTDRQGMYDEQRQAVTAINSKDVNQQYADTERQNRFGLARSGLLGGSADVDTNANLTRIQNDGLIKAAGLGDQAAADLQSKDEQTRQQLISMAQSGLDTDQASSIALNGLAANDANAASAASGSTVGSLFNNLTSAYLYNQQANGVKTGLAPFQQSLGNSARTGGSNGTVG